MTVPAEPSGLDQQVAAWREYLAQHRALSAADINELEDHLRDQVADLTKVGLSDDEAFLVSVKRLGAHDALSWEYAREHSDRLWKQLVLGGTDDNPAPSRLPLALGLAVCAGLAIKLPELFGLHFAEASDSDFYLRNLAFFVLPFLAVYFAARYRPHPGLIAALVAGFALPAVAVNLYPLTTSDATFTLTVVSLPIALWALVGLAYVGGEWRSGQARMDFVRFTGEWAIYYVLIGLGGAVLIGTTMAVFSAIGAGGSASTVITSWVLPCGAMGAVLIAAWLVEAKQSVVENMAPVLTKVFTPLFALMLAVLLVTLAWQPPVLDVARDLLIAFDLLLVIVFALLLYAVSARDALAPPTLSDLLQLLLVVTALAVDVYVLIAMLGRIGAFGLSPNKMASLGLNLILLVNLAVSAVLLARFLRGNGPFTSLERWQTGFLPVSFGWAAVVALAFPPLFGFV